MPPGDTRSERTAVRIVGLGAVSGYGWGRKHLQQGLLSGRSAVRPAPHLTSSLAEQSPWVARVPEEHGAPAGADLVSQAVLHAVREAIDDAHDRGWRASGPMGIVHRLPPGDGPMDDQPAVAQVAKEFGLHGPVVGVDAMTASTVAGVLTARSWIEGAMADDVVVVIADLGAPPARLDAYRKLGVLAAGGAGLESCRPFQQGSRGSVPGEAVVAMVVSARGPGAYADVLGGALAYDERHTAPPGVGAGPVRATYDDALEHSGVEPGAVTYVNAHGSGVPEADAVEAAVFDELFPGAAGIFSVKPLVGHCGAAAGAVELCASLYGFETGVIPAPPRRAAGHPRLLDGPTAATDGVVAKASFGMSGHCGVLLLGRPAA